MAEEEPHPGEHLNSWLVACAPCPPPKARVHRLRRQTQPDRTPQEARKRVVWQRGWASGRRRGSWSWCKRVGRQLAGVRGGLRGPGSHAAEEQVVDTPPEGLPSRALGL